MNRNRSINNQNFALGMRRDGALSPEPHAYLRSIKNYKIDYVDGALTVRSGYKRWNAKPLSDHAYQLYYFVDRLLNENLLAILGTGINARWYRLSETSTHAMIIDETATSPDGYGYRKPIITWNDRCFFATNYGWYWTSNELLASTTKYYQAGIDKPTDQLILSLAPAIGNYTNCIAPSPVTQPTLCYRLYDNSPGKIAADFTIDAETSVAAVTMILTWFYTNPPGRIRITLETDNAGVPSGTLANAYGYSDWVNVAGIVKNPGVYESVIFHFMDSFVLDPGKYWVVIESDDNYKDSFNETNFFICFMRNSETGKNYNIATMTWSDSAYKFYFFIGAGLDPKFYDYVYTLVNSTYGIESRPGEKNRIRVTTDTPLVKITTPNISDPQVDKIRLYRREFPLDLGINAPDDLITDTYKYVAEFGLTSSSYYDTIAGYFLSGELQTWDHYRIDEADDTGEGRRDAILPKVATVWKGRVWVVPSLSNTIYYSKKLEEDGPSGLTGDMIPDYFPLDNQLQIPGNEPIIRLEPLAGDQLAIYCKNGSIWVMWGCDSVLNPLPVEDYALREMITTNGLSAYAGVTNFRGRHIYLSRKGLYSFSGSPNIEYLSENIQSILNDIHDVSQAVIVTLGDELLLLIDEDSDGINDNIYIVDLQKSVPAWRYYNYNVGINDIIHVYKDADKRILLAADADNKYILHLEHGTDDNGLMIETEIETHNIKVNERVMIYTVEIVGYYPNTAPTYQVDIIDNESRVSTYWISPRDNSDVRSNRTGTRVISVDTIRLRVMSSSFSSNQLRKLTIGFIDK